MLTQGVNEIMQTQDPRDSKGRGIQIYSYSQLLGIQARNKTGELETNRYDNPYFYLSPEDRIRIAQLCTPVLSVVTSRMNKISAMRFIVTNDRVNEDKIYEEMKSKFQVWKEFQNAGEVEYIVARAKIKAELKTALPELLPDFSNFDNCLVRWRKRLQLIKTEQADEVYDWLQQPNASDKWMDFMKKCIFDLMIHGTVPVYKEDIDNRLENIYTLAGGTVVPIKDMYVSAKTGFIQIIDGYEPQKFYPDELSFWQYIPTTSRSYGLVPIEALINKVAESMLFDKLMADYSDGTRPPEKMIIINDQSPFGNPDKDLVIPIAVEEQKRLEEKLQTPIKHGVMTFTGNNATIVDLSRADTFATQMQRQKDIREEVAMVFNMTNMEINLTGSGDTSGRETSESQAEIEQGKGIVPILKLIETKFKHDILPFRFGHGFNIEFQTSKNEEEELRKWQLKLQTGLYSVNEIRVKDLNEQPYSGDEYNKPQGSQPQQTGTEQNPLVTRSIK